MSRLTLTNEQIGMVRLYSEYNEDELTNLIGNLCAEYADEKTRDQYVMGVPNIFERGKVFVLDVTAKFAGLVCPERERFVQFFGAKQKSMGPLKWVAVLLDIGLSKLTGGVPPIAIAVAIGKLCDYSLEVLCRKHYGSRAFARNRKE